ncbi:hypothetical protein ABRQ22_13370 [Cellulosimicrobium sp. ES-005]|uniref:DUF4178 domain-containing protein n=1 Tax=Cellulosimicrobium sp. ES-005 TaxID=3163031 RepID=A0AAU8FYR9_9MICO
MNKVVYRTLFLGTAVGGVAGALLLSTGRTGPGIVCLVLAFCCGASIVVTAVVKVAAQQRGRARVTVVERPVATPARPSSLDVVVGALAEINGEDLPYEVTAQRTERGARVVVRWKTEDLRWQTVFSHGSRTYAWKMDVDLDAAHSRYRFVEYSASRARTTRMGPGGSHVDGGWEWERGKTAGRIRMSGVMTADGEVTSTSNQGVRTSWEGAVSIRPADAKVPVFTTLRNHGWRPRADWWGARLFEK